MMALIKTMSGSEQIIIPEGLNVGFVEHSSGTVTITPANATFGNIKNDTIVLSVGEKWEVPEGVDVGGWIVETSAASGANVRLYRVGGKPSGSNEGRKK